MPQANETEAFKVFLATCYEYHVCHHAACSGLQQFSGRVDDKIRLHSVPRGAPYHVGTGNPFQGTFPSHVPIGEMLDKSVQDGDFSNLIAKSFVAAIYSVWEERYRWKIAEELGLPGQTKTERKESKDRIRSDLMYDVNQIRRCIVHRNSVISNEHKKLKELKWSLCPGPLRVTHDMLVDLMDQINRMEIQVSFRP